MCGIVGYIGENVEEILIDKLKRLEYRGYDSSGISIIDNGVFRTYKAKGEINNLRNIVDFSNNFSYGIGHTRWATHGKPNENNAHPHVSANGKWVLVHNGIIENYQELKKMISSKGVSFYSETDTETIAKLLELYEDNGSLLAIKKTCESLVGSYAIGILHMGDNKIYFAKNKSPLYVAIVNGKAMLASDIICFCDFAESYYTIEDGEYGYIDKDDFHVYKNEVEITKSATKIDISNTCNDNNYQHYMLKEIMETKLVIKNIIEYYSCTDNVKNVSRLDISTIRNIKLIGCGTAYNACLVGADMLQETLRISCDCVVASEFRYSNPIIDEHTLVILVSQSGETADTLAACELAKQHKCKIIGIVNVEYSTLAKAVDVCLPIKAGVELAVASTKAYTAQLIVFYILANYLQKRSQQSIIEYIMRLYDNIDFEKQDIYRNVAELLIRQQNMFMIGRRLDYATAQEASLKIKETCYINSDTYYAGELKHGFLALIDNDTYIVIFATDRSVLSKVLSNAEEAYARGAQMILLTCMDDIPNGFLNKCKIVLKVPCIGNSLQTVANIIPCQLIAYYTSIKKGINPDRPRNLAKSVTVE